MEQVEERVQAAFASWHGVNHLIAFGDSYTTTGFRVNGEQPRPANPFGNPQYPGLTTSNGPNWIDFLTTTYNDTFVKTVNFAFGGATVDQAIIPQFLPAIKSFKDQLFDFYLPHYSAAPVSFPWKASDTLFTFFFGINDVHTAILKPTPGASTAQILTTAVARYAAFIDVVYHSGARNFLFINVPPVERAPTVTIKGAAEVHAHAEAIVQWNRDVSALTTNLTTTYPDVTTFLFDANSLFNQVMDEPCSYEETCALEDTSASCEQYIRNNPATWYSKDPACRYAVDHYFWLNMLHPTFRIHNVTAKLIAQQLR
ncbi:hypothetical protein BDY17DRAFT_338602 [Neohortaea acidophila]|uniref:Carbohydrate esterase family 16 protein n=1 Tax=Neohortaea acidophila TaxID=245834 RepID=A0A6A6Q0R6_9PEZI|nr:uncharacterized protein BDY17DRAFT_338602 [Neohortaea acidophila]KAF2485855.1 hypothetical protein BDY17DRAFT_338602 [Neohortaea acidophila]